MLDPRAGARLDRARRTGQGAGARRRTSARASRTLRWRTRTRPRSRASPRSRSARRSSSRTAWAGRSACSPPTSTSTGSTASCCRTRASARAAPPTWSARDHRFVNKILATGAYAGEIHSRGIDSAVARQSGQGLYTNYRGVPVIGVYRWLPEREAALVVEMTQEQAFAPARRLALEIGAIGVGVVLSDEHRHLLRLAAHRAADPRDHRDRDGRHRGRPHARGAGDVARRDRHARRGVQRHDRSAARHPRGPRAARGRSHARSSPCRTPSSRRCTRRRSASCTGSTSTTC